MPYIAVVDDCRRLVGADEALLSSRIAAVLSGDWALDASADLGRVSRDERDRRAQP